MQSVCAAVCPVVSWFRTRSLWPTVARYAPHRLSWCSHLPAASICYVDTAHLHSAGDRKVQCKHVHVDAHPQHTCNTCFLRNLLNQGTGILCCKARLHHDRKDCREVRQQTCASERGETYSINLLRLPQKYKAFHSERRHACILAVEVLQDLGKRWCLLIWLCAAGSPLLLTSACVPFQPSEHA